MLIKVSKAVFILTCIIFAHQTSYGQDANIVGVKPSYNIKYDEQHRLRVILDVEWKNLSKIELREFINFDCAVGGYIQPQILSGGVITNIESQNSTIIPSRNAKRLKIAYSVTPKHSDKTLTISAIEACKKGIPFVRGTDFFLLRASLLFPRIRYYNHDDELINHQHKNTEIIWHLPEDWALGNTINIDGQTKSLFPNGIDYEQYIIAGKVRVSTKNHNDSRHARSFSGDSFTKHIEKVHLLIEQAYPYFTERFWKPASHTQNSLIIIPLENDFSNKITGRAGHGQQIIFITANYDYAYNQWELDFAAIHELVHSWNPIDLRNNSRFPYRHDIPLWLSEGVTDLATYQYLADHYPNGAQYFQMGVNAALEFAAGHNIEENPYAYGLLLSLQHDMTQQDKCCSDSNIYNKMQNLRAMVKAQTEKPYDNNDFADIFFSPRHRPFYDEKLFPQKIRFKDRRLELVREGLPEYDKGLELDYGGAYHAKVTSITAGGPAESAGIEVGDIIINRIAGNSGDVHNKLIYRIQKNDGSLHTIDYWPHGRKLLPPRLFYKLTK